ncbi:MAG: protein kinase domain-containing protein [Actinophytocola sp.]|uniref:serine/threonine-protein kinase n=1 Tax=Actinophytocola sp. TaxID=1872138 RepID=UPI003D6A4F36
MHHDVGAADEVAGLLGGRYRLGPRIGSGGMAAVHSAVDIDLGREVAVKVYQAGGNATDLYRFGAEARLLASLSHPALVTVYDVCLGDDRPYLVMQLVAGTTLRDLIDRGPLEPAAVARLGARLADVLAYVHTHGVVHRDVKPANVLVDKADVCYLADFGLARVLEAAHLTGSHEIVGTAAYLAPEQVAGTDTGPPVDVYALGLVLLECLTARTEYHGTTAETALARLSRGPRIPEGLSPAWRSALTAMTARDPADRPDGARCAELLRAISRGRAATRVPAAALAPPPGPPVRTVPSGRRPVHIGLAVAALGATLAGILTAGATSTVAGRPSGSPPQQTPAPTTEPTSPPPAEPSDLPTAPPPPGGAVADAPGPAPALGERPAAPEPTQPTSPEPTPAKPSSGKPKPAKPAPERANKGPAPTPPAPR